MITTYNLGTINFEFWEWILIAFIIGVSYFIGARVKIKNVHKNPAYKYLIPALMFKIFSGLFFGFIYVFYYGGGDTISYYASTVPLVNLFYENTSDYFDVIFNSSNITANFGREEWEAYTFNAFTNETGIPLSYISHDPKTFAVCKLTSPLLILTNNSYFACTALISSLTFIPLWKLYASFLKFFPILQKELAYGVLYIPSVAFWGSGIMKDTYTFAAVCLAVYCFSNIIENKNKFLNTLGILISMYLILSIKPYILNILVPAMGIWTFALIIKKVENIIFRFLVLPFIFASALGGSFFVLSSLGGSMDKFALDSAIDTAIITNEDLKNEDHYGANNFDIGKLDGSITGFISKFPQATFAGLFRPAIIEAGSPVMLLSGLENLILLGLLIFTFVKVKISVIYNLIKSSPILIFCFTFAILFAFMLGITTPNFGALVRFKIPLIPFFSAALVIIFSANKLLTNNNDKLR